MNEIISTGMELSRIKNRVHCRYDTVNAEKIIHALDKGGVPHFAKYNDKALALTYDGSFKAVVDEIINKTESGDFNEMLLEIKNKKNKKGCRILVPEVAEVLEMSVGAVNNRPDEIVDTLCLAYIKLWHCDKNTIKRELSEIIRVNNFVDEKEESIIGTLSRESQRKSYEIFSQSHEHENTEQERILQK